MPPVNRPLHKAYSQGANEPIFYRLIEHVISLHCIKLVWYIVLLYPQTTTSWLLYSSIACCRSRSELLFLLGTIAQSYFWMDGSCYGGVDRWSWSSSSHVMLVEYCSLVVVAGQALFI